MKMRNNLWSWLNAFLKINLLVFLICGCDESSQNKEQNSTVSHDVSKQGDASLDADEAIPEAYILVDEEVRFQWKKNDSNQGSLALAEDESMYIFIPCEQVDGLQVECETYYRIQAPLNIGTFEAEDLQLASTSKSARTLPQNPATSADPRRASSNRTLPSRTESSSKRGEISRAEFSSRFDMPEGVSFFDRDSYFILDNQRSFVPITQSQYSNIKNTNQNLGRLSLKDSMKIFPSSEGSLSSSSIKKTLRVARLKLERAISPNPNKNLRSLEIQYLKIGVEKMYENNFSDLKLLVQNGKVPKKDLEKLPLKGFGAPQITGGSLKDIDLRDQYELTEFVQMKADLFFKTNKKKTIILGHLPDTHADTWGRSKSIEILKIDDWTLEKNLNWLKDHMKKGSKIILGSQPRQHNKSDEFAPVYHAELRVLLEGGYVRVGDEMVPMKSIKKEFRDQQYINGVCIHKKCY